jgi:radical SAM protein with 4Fe4S-binding SPASM domain
MVKKYKLSKFVYEFDSCTIDSSNYIALFHAFTMGVAFIDKQAYIKIKDYLKNPLIGVSMPDEFDALQENDFIVNENSDEDYLYQQSENALNVLSPTTLRLQLTDVCNLNCKYCQIERNYEYNKGLHMSSELAKRSIDLFDRFAPKDKQKTVIFTGGEPLLNFDVIKEVLNYAKAKLTSCRFIVFTNGISVTEKIAEIFLENNVLVLFSLDGEKEQHDKYRTDRFGNGSFEKTLKGYQICKEKGCRVGISGVVGNHNADYIADSILDFYLKINPDSLGLNFPHYLLESDNSDLLSMERYSEIIIESYLKLRPVGLYMENINRWIEPFVKQKINGKECAALGRGITVLPNGMVGPCKTLLVAGKMGKPIDEIESLDKLEDDVEFQKWGNRSTYSLSSCKDCVAISLCGTGCTYDSFVVNGNIDGVDPRTCVLIKRILEFLLKDLFRIVKDNIKSKTYIPTLADRQKIYSSIRIKDDDLKRSAGHEI